MSRTLKLIIGLIAAVIILGAGWYLASPLFINNTVDEAFPIALPSMEEAKAMDGEELTNTLNNAVAQLMDDDMMDDMSEDEKQAFQQQVEELAAEMPDEEMDDPMPEASTDPVVIGTGNFVGADAFHEGQGSATFYELPDGQRVLRFEDFEVTNGPDLHVILVKHPNPESRDEVGDDYVDLGKLKGNIGSQNYDIPADIDLNEYQSVVIYCMPFHVVFSTATIGG